MVGSLAIKWILITNRSFQASVHHPCAIWERTSEWNPEEQVIFSCTLTQCPIYIPKVDKQNKMFREMIMSLQKLSNTVITSKYLSSILIKIHIFLCINIYFSVKHHVNLCTYRIFWVGGWGWFTYMCNACNLPIYVKIIGTSKHHLYIIIII